MSIKSLKLEIFLTNQFKHMFRVLKRTVSMSTHNLFWLSNKKFGTQLKPAQDFLIFSIKNSGEILDKLKARDFNATSLSTYDFSTLYTTLPHNLIKDKLIDLI